MQFQQMYRMQELNDSELYVHLDSFKFPLEAGKEECWKQLQENFTSSQKQLEERQYTILTLRNSGSTLESLFTGLESLKESESILKEQKTSQTETAAEGQIFFQGDDYKPLNFIPFFLTIIVFCKLWVFPVLGLLTPVLLFISPYILLQTMFNVRITWEVYIQMMKQLVFGIQGNEPWTLKHLAQALWTIVGLGQGVVQPFLTSYHTAKLDAAIVQKGNALLHIHSKLQSIHATLQKMGIASSLELPEIPSDVREAVAWMNAEPLGMKTIWTLLGRYTILITLAHDRTWSPVEFTQRSLVLDNLSDLAISKERAVCSEITLKGHCLLTGPNRGGKSSSLRAILQQVLLGQTFGFTRYATGSWTPYRNVLTRLKSHDTSGKESLFEMEVRNASRMLKKAKGNSLVLIDELFHSTNPPDAETSAKVFLKRLWTMPIQSIISTHIFSLCEAPPPNIQTLCCPAMETETKIQYSYSLQEGICRVSSVKEVLQEAGL